MVKKTMAILADTGEFPPILMKILGKLDLRLLFVSEAESKNEKVKKQLKSFKTTAEIEFISCEKEGCWEADIILLTRPENISSALVEKIKEVATQKIVLVVSEDKNQPDKPGLEKSLPYSKIVELNFESQGNEFSVSGEDAEARADAQNIFEIAGYQLKK